MKRFFIQLLCLLLLVSMVSCGNDQAEAPVSSTNPPAETNAPAAEEEYAYYGEYDFDNYEFRILNYDTYVETNLRFVPNPDAENDLLSDAMFKRNT